MPNFAFRYQAVRSSDKIDANAVGVSSGSEPAKAAILMKSRLLRNIAWFGGQVSGLGTVLPGTVAFVVFRADGIMQRIFVQFVGLQALKLRLTAQKRSYSITPRLAEHSFTVERRCKSYFRSHL